MRSVQHTSKARWFNSLPISNTSSVTTVTPKSNLNTSIFSVQSHLTKNNIVKNPNHTVSRNYSTKYTKKGLLQSHIVSSVANDSNISVTAAYSQYCVAVRNLHSSIHDRKSNPTNSAMKGMVVFREALNYHSVASLPSMSDASPIVNGIHSPKAAALNPPTITELSLAMKTISESVQTGKFFDLTYQQQLKLFQPISVFFYLQRESIDTTDSVSLELFESIFNLNYEQAVDASGNEVLKHLHEAILTMSSYKDFVDEVEGTNSKKNKNTPDNKNDGSEDPQDNKPEDNKNDKPEDPEKPEKPEDKKPEDGDKKTDESDPLKEKTESKEDVVENKTDTEPKVKENSTEKLAKLSEEKLNEMYKKAMKDVEAMTEKQSQAKKEAYEKRTGEKIEDNKGARMPWELNPKDPQDKIKLGLLAVGVFLLIGILFSMYDHRNRTNNTYRYFVENYLSQGRVKHISIQGNRAIAHLTNGEVYPFDFISYSEFDRRIRQDITAYNVGDVPLIVDREPAGLSSYSWIVFPIVFFFAINSLTKGMKGFPPGLGRDPFSSGRKFTATVNVKERFKDVAGIDGAKQEIMEFVDFLKQPEKYQKLGARLPKGALLSGPPGTGKTLLAKATAGEADVSFFSIAGSDFMQMFVGVGSSRVRELFAAARKQAPSIIFIDEIDAIARSRSSGKNGGGNDEREATLNQLLVEMDGFGDNEAVVVFAGTNRPELLDSAITRAGRFDRKITVDLPDIEGRSAIFRVHLKRILTGLDKSEVASKLAALTPGMSGADISSICNEAAILAVRDKKDSVLMEHFESAIDRVIAGMEMPKNRLTPEERKRVAIHESGHAVVGWMLDHCDPLLKVTIVPRSSGALGFAQYLPKDTALYETNALLDTISKALAGRAAEHVYYNNISTGASDDLKKTTTIAFNMITRYGMSDKLYNVNYVDSNENPYYRSYSEDTAKVVDEEVLKIVDIQYKRAIDIITANKDKMDGLIAALLEKETVNHDQLVEILGERNVTSDHYRDYISAQRDLVRELSEEEMKKQEEETKKENEERDELMKKEREATEERRKALEKDKSDEK